MGASNAEILAILSDVRNVARWFYRRYRPPCTVDECVSDAEFALIRFGRDDYDQTRLGKDGKPVSLKGWCLRRVVYYLRSRMRDYGPHTRGKMKRAAEGGWTLPDLVSLGDAFDAAWPSRPTHGDYLDELIPRLTPKVRAAVQLRLDGISLAESAKRLGVHYHTVRSNVSRGLKQLRKIVNEERGQR